MTTDVLMCKEAGASIYTLSINDEGDLTSGDFFDSSLLYSIFGEKRASASEVVVSEQRRGWIGNEGKDFENGSKIWLFRQARLTRTNINGLRSAIFNSLQWLIAQNFLKNITVSVTIDKGAVIAEIILFRFNSKVERRYFELWDNTGAC